MNPPNPSTTAWPSNQSATGKKRKRKSGCGCGLARKKPKLKISRSVSRRGRGLARIKPKPKSHSVSNRHAMGNDNAINSDAQHTDKNDNYGPITSFMRGALIGPCRTSRFPSIASDIPLPTRPNFPPVISTDAFEIINWDQNTETMESNKYFSSSALKLLPTLMSIVESRRVYLLHISILFLASIAFGAKYLCDTHLWQLYKVLNLK